MPVRYSGQLPPKKAAIKRLVRRGILPSEFMEVQPARAEKKMTAAQRKKYEATTDRIRARRHSS